MKTQIAAWAGALLLLVVVVVGGWQLYWWSARHGVDNRYQVNTHSQQYQSALETQLRDYAHDYGISTDPGQQAQLKAMFCTRYQDLTHPEADLRTAYTTTFAC